MSEAKKWDDLFEEASQEVLRWRRKNKKATLTLLSRKLVSERET
jgi:hypothetical protein